MTSTQMERQRIFEYLPVPNAVAAMILPTIVSQIIHVIYNLADTWFVGLTGDPNAVAAVSLCLPLFNILTGFSNLFGLGGASMIARFLGIGNTEHAKRSFAVAFWGASLSSLAYSLILLACAKPLLLLIGADSGDLVYAYTYTLVTIIIGGFVTVLSATLANMIRATGESKKAATGMTFGALLNVALDPLFMFVLLPRGHEVLGAAIATAISNLFSLLYFLRYFHRQNGADVYQFQLNLLLGSGKFLKGVLRSGLPGFTMISAAMISNCVLNAMIANLGAGTAVAGLGIVRKIDSLAYAVNQGITQGMLPLVAYCYTAKKRKRMRDVIFFSGACTFLFSMLSSAISFALAPQLISVFLRDEATIRYGTEFLKIQCLAVPIYSVTFIVIAVFQAVGRSIVPFLLSVLHKGSVDILLMFFIRELFGLEYILWASPVMEMGTLLIALPMLYRLLRNLRQCNVSGVDVSST